MNVSRIMLAFINEPGLTEQEYQRVRDASKYLNVIAENIRTGQDNPFEGLDFKKRQDLLAYAVFTRENGFTNTSEGDTPVEDSVRDLVRRTDLFKDKEIPGQNLDKEFLNTQLVKQLHRLPSKPLEVGIDLDANGLAHIVKEQRKEAVTSH